MQSAFAGRPPEIGLSSVYWYVSIFPVCGGYPCFAEGWCHNPVLDGKCIHGVAWSAAFIGSMRGLLDKTSKEDKPGVLSAIFLISYSDAAVPNQIVGDYSAPSAF